MGQAIGDVLPLAIGVAISLVPIIAIILMLGTPRFAIASGNAASSSVEPATWVGVLQLVLGLGLLFLLDRMKAWMAAHDAAIMTVLLLVLGAKLTATGSAA